MPFCVGRNGVSVQTSEVLAMIWLEKWVICRSKSSKEHHSVNLGGLGECFPHPPERVWPAHYDVLRNTSLYTGVWSFTIIPCRMYLPLVLSTTLTQRINE